MTDEQVIQALECCSKGFGNCEGCPYDDDNSDCVTIKGETLMIKDALDLINRKDAKVELLTMDVNSLTSERDALQEMAKEQKAEIERLNNELVSADEVIGFREAEIERLNKLVTEKQTIIGELSALITDTCEDCKVKLDANKAKSEAYKEFAERLKEKRDGGTYPYVLVSVIDNLLKELTCNLHETCTEGGNEDGTDSIQLQKNDEYYTPSYAVYPIMKKLKEGSTVWCPFDTKDSNFVKVLKKNGFKVIHTHIFDGQDFFEQDVPECDYIISNPPYSLKSEVFKRLYEINKPFAMLVNLQGIFDCKDRFELFKNNRVEMLWLSPRVNYIKEDGSNPRGVPFQSGYLCCGICDKQLEFEFLNKERF